MEGPARELWQLSLGCRVQDGSDGCEKQGTWNFCFLVSIIALYRHLVSSL